MSIYNPLVSPFISIAFNIPATQNQSYIPNNVMQLFDDDFDYWETANHKELADYAVTQFVGMMNVPTVPSGGGGGTSSDLSWGRKEDKDEMGRARRCACAAIAKYGRRPKTSRKW